MDMNEDQFWTALRGAVQRAEQPTATEIAAAERQLAATEAGAEDELSAERIDEIVARATAAEAAGDAGEHDAEQPRALAPMRLLPGLRRVLAAAAAFLLAPKFLAAATVVTAVAVGAYVLRYTTQSLDYQDAVLMMLDENLDDESRRTALGRVALDILESIKVIREAGEDPQLEAPASFALASLRTLLEAPLAPQHPMSHHSVTGLAEVLAASADPQTRAQAILLLGNELAYGVYGIRKLLEDGPPSPLTTAAAAYLSKVGARLPPH